ncbi:MAG: hypothetical protein SNH55_05515 [Rikenellaceae bacterium]
MFCLGQTYAAEESVSDNAEQLSEHSSRQTNRQISKRLRRQYEEQPSEQSSEELSREEFRQNRGLVDMQTEFVPKGQWIVGATGSYSTHTNENFTLLVVDGIQSEGYSINITPTVAYAFRTNTVAGVRFKYNRSLLRIYDAELSIGGEDGTQIVVNDFYALSHSYVGSAVVRQYIPIGKAKRFALFSDIELEGGRFQSKFANDYPVKGTFSEGYTMGFGVTPGIIAFATNDVAFEVSVGMLGVGYTHTEQVHNQVYVGEVNSSKLNFKINLLTIGLGVSIYL